MEENGLGTMSADTALEPSEMYVVLPSYAEPHKKAIKTSSRLKKQYYAAIVCSKTALLRLTLKLLLLTART